MIPGIVPGGSSIGPQTILNWTWHYNFSDDGEPTTVSSKTLSSVSIGAANVWRHVFVAVACTNSTDPDPSCTIGGIAATRIHHDNAVSTSWNFSTFIARVPSGTTADIVITYADDSSWTSVGVWTGDVGRMPTNHDSDSSTSSSPGYQLNVVAGGVVIGWSIADSTPSFTWSNGMNEHHETFHEGSAAADYSHASDEQTTTESNKSIGYSATSGSTYRSAVLSLAPTYS
jgi:hypothetical protein